jgi:putative ABC transport system ATP-binding protein
LKKSLIGRSLTLRLKIDQAQRRTKENHYQAITCTILLMATNKSLAELIKQYGNDYNRLRRDIDAAEQEARRTSRPQRSFANAQVVVELKHVAKHYKLGKTRVDAVSDVSLQVHAGEIVALTGPSGSGKSTILHMIGGLDKPSEGEVLVDGVDLGKMRDGQLSRYRNQKMGFVFQFFYLQPFLNLQTNVEVPTMFSRLDRSQRHERSNKLLDNVGLSDRKGHQPKELSGGQMQRAAIARALMNNPSVLLADEPTGNLDTVNAQGVIELFEKVRTEHNTAVVIVTHDPKIADRADRIIELQDGRIL